MIQVGIKLQEMTLYNSGLSLILFQWVYPFSKLNGSSMHSKHALASGKSTATIIWELQIMHMYNMQHVKGGHYEKSSENKSHKFVSFSTKTRPINFISNILLKNTFFLSFPLSESIQTLFAYVTA